MAWLNAREQIILAAIVERHIETAEPVSSQQLCHHYGFAWSAPTVRNVMASLEERGFLSHPYTSAGKVPTVQAYRFFVEGLMTTQVLTSADQRKICYEILQQVMEADQLVKLSTRVLAVVSHLLAFAWLPFRWDERLAGIRLPRVSQHRLLLEVHTVSGRVHEQVIDLEEAVSDRLLGRLAVIINQEAKNLNAAAVAKLADSEWPGLESGLRAWLQRALAAVGSQLQSPAPADMVLEGTANLIYQPEFDDIVATRRLVTALEQRDAIVTSLERPGIERGRVRVVIGDDNPDVPALSLVTESVGMADGRTARIGVIGPRRMPYSRIVPLVEYTAAALTEAMARVGKNRN